jgi:hypothetical protein
MSPELDRVLSRLQGVRRHGSRWAARCPAHEDRHPSLSVRLGRDGAVLLHCFVGCSIEAIVGALDLRMSDLFPEQRGLPRSLREDGDRGTAERRLPHASWAPCSSVGLRTRRIATRSARGGVRHGGSSGDACTRRRLR